MRPTVLKTKLHKACVTHSELEYDGSCAIDGIILDKVRIHEYEQIQVYNLTNGERFTTYAIRAENGSRIVSINGAAAHKARPGDRIIICSYVSIDENNIVGYKPTIVYLDENNNIIHMKDHVPVQAA